MLKKCIEILNNKENIFIFLLFLCFFPLKTQTQNLLYYLFDQLFRDGITTKIFTLNYTGLLVGCDAVAELRKLNPNFSWFQKQGIFYVQFIPSILAFFYLLYRKFKGLTFKKLDWILLIIVSFKIYWAINYTLFYFFYGNKQFYFPSFIFLMIGTYIFFKIFTFKERIQTSFIGVIGCFISLKLWYGWLGSLLLPIAN